MSAHPPLAFQVWDAVGWLGQAVFAWRVIEQWIASEKAKRSVVPPSFWSWSLVGTAALVVYTLHRQDPVFLAGFLVNGFIYARNLRLAVREPGDVRRASPFLPVAVGLVAFLAVVGYGVWRETALVRFDTAPAWLVAGFTGQAFWSSRFVLQWLASERAGRSVMPEAFFWASLVGCVGLFAYAVHRTDWVQMAAYALNPIPYVRNIVLIRRARRAPAAGPPTP